MFRFLVPLALLLGLTPLLTAQEEVTPRISVEWMNTRGWQLALVAEHKWLKDGSAIYWEPSGEGLGRGVQRIDPSTGESGKHMSFRTAALSIMKLDRSVARGLGFPDAFDEAGRRALYLLQGDIFVYDVRAERAVRVTETPTEEKAVRFSPDGNKIAFVRENDLFVHDLESSKTRRLTDDGSATTLNGTVSWVYWEEIFGRQDIGYWWSGDSKTLAFLRTDETPVSTIPYLDFEADPPKVIEQRYPRVGSTNPTVTVGLVDVGGDAPTRWVDFDDHVPEYVVRLKWLPDSGRVSIQTLSRDHRRLDLFFAGRDDAKTKHVLVENDTGWVNVHDDLFFMKDGRHFLWVSERSGYSHVYRYDLEGKLVNQVTKGDFALRDPGGVYWLRQAIKGIDEEKGILYFSALEKSSIENHLYRVGLDGKGMKRISEADGKHKISFDPTARYFFNEFSSGRRPPSLSLHKADGTLVTVITAPRLKQAAAFNFAYPEFLTIPTPDGVDLPACIYRPHRFDKNKKYPVIIHGYGGPSAPTVSNEWQVPDLYFNQMLLERGFIVFSIDNRSATAISKTFENTITGQLYGDGELEDLLAGVTWLKKQSWVDEDRLGIWGWSGGGSLTLLAMTRSKEFKAGIAVAPVTAWRYYDTFWAESVMKKPQDNPDGYRHTDLVARAPQMHGRVMLVHGTYDDNVHIQNSYKFADALIRAGKLFDMMIYPMRKHGIADVYARNHLFRTMLDFWVRHL